MFGLFKHAIEREKVVRDIVETHLDRLIGKINERLERDHKSNRARRESMAFVYVIGIFGIQLSRLRYTEKHRFSMTLSQIWSGKLPWDDDDKPTTRPIIFLQERLKEYRSMRGPIAIAQRYMDHLGINDSQHLDFLVEMGDSIECSNIIADFIDEVRKGHKFV
jgi:hypothetical protein